MPLPSISVPNFSGVSTPVNTPNSGRQAATDSAAVVLSNEDNAAIGSLTETAPASDTASSGLNGRLQRIAQRLSSLIALLPSALGSQTSANSLSITHASNDAVATATGAISDAAWASGNGSLVALLKAIAAQAVSTAPSPVVMSLTPKTVAVSQSNFVLGATGAAGDTLSGIIIQPTGTTVGSVIVYDGVTAIYTYPGGTVSADLRPIVVPLGAACATAWKVTTPSNATVTALGKFT